MVSSVTGFTPIEARKPRHEFAVKLHITLNAKKTRMYPELRVNDEVKVMRKKGISEKERTSHYVKTPQTVKRIEKKLGQNYYYLENNENRGYLRHELLKV